MSMAIFGRMLDGPAPIDRRDTTDEGRARRIVAGLRRGYRLEKGE